MPAYRSADEAEIRDAVVARLRQLRPEARIIHEINASSFGNRIDVLAVDHAEIIAVEVKSRKDKLARLPKQIEAMRGVAHHVIAAIHEKFLVPYRYAANCTVPNAVEPPPEARGAMVWAYPEVGNGRMYGCSEWEAPRPVVTQPVPWTALHLLWRDELYDLCGELKLSVPRRATMGFMVNALRWNCTGRELTLGICTALRARRCVEADPEIET